MKQIVLINTKQHQLNNRKQRLSCYLVLLVQIIVHGFNASTLPGEM